MESVEDAYAALQAAQSEYDNLTNSQSGGDNDPTPADISAAFANVQALAGRYNALEAARARTEAAGNDGGLTVGQIIELAVTGAGQGFQGAVIDPLGTTAGLIVYTNVPGSATVGGAAGIGGYVSVSRDNNGTYTVIVSGGVGLGTTIDVSTNTPQLGNIGSNGILFGSDSRAGTTVGPATLSGQVNFYGIGDGTNTTAVVNVTAQGGLAGSIASGGGEINAVFTNSPTAGWNSGYAGGGIAGVGGGPSVLGFTNFVYHGFQLGLVNIGPNAPPFPGP